MITTARKIALVARLAAGPAARSLYGAVRAQAAAAASVAARSARGVDFSIFSSRLEPATSAHGRWSRQGVVFDIGANVGSHTLPLARLAARGRVRLELTVYAGADANLR
jgi:hypothetical protein